MIKISIIRNIIYVVSILCFSTIASAAEADSQVTASWVSILPPLLTIAVALAFKAGMFNIGANGQLILGAILDIFSAIVLVVPLILPVAVQFGVDPVHLGIVFLATMQLGYITPPVGLNLFIASYRFDRPVVELYLSTLPFFIFLLISVTIIAFWPGLSLALLD